MSLKKFKTTIVVMLSILIVSLFATTLGSTYASADSNGENNEPNSSELQKIQAASPESIERLLNKVNNVSVNESNINDTDTSIVSEPVYHLDGTWGCALSIGEFIATSAFPYTKILKIKRYLKVLGGVTKAVKFIKMNKKGFFAPKKVRNAAAGLVGELTGVTSVYNACFK
ncbi:hypothetical protein [Apilactobacillus micheneri]|uniref:hypothetical protein n=1 Tax=Apilactobacillus micheneri TaxID=1899430 RepID=UPI00112959F3|nr:hypothetical protein [Apilactobacillus micheneri]TPR50749.1 hypothetical protein DY126_06790 [Apilactobacillus micheneri]